MLRKVPEGSGSDVRYKEREIIVDKVFLAEPKLSRGAKLRSLGEAISCSIPNVT